MPSMIVAAGLMALSGMATAFPQGGFSNTTAGAVGNNNGTSPAPANPVTESLFCPRLSGSVIRSRTGTSEFILECSTNHFGVIIDVTFNSTIFNKRQAAVAPANIQDCLAACDTVTACVGTAFDATARTCTLYSEVGAAYAADNTDFAVRIAAAAPTTVPAGATATSTLYSTNVQTIRSCAPTVTNCPLAGAVGGAAVVTQIVAVSSTEYICPTATVLPLAPVACACAYSASTATVYSVSGSTVVPVQTKVVAVPSPSGSTYATTTVVGSAALTTAPGSAATAGANGANGAGVAAGASGSKTTSAGLASFTGGASNTKAGMGLIVGVAAAALML